ncbi:MAG: hypothetical protein EOO10_18755 [Chitinophagaceae bacterium]|nr:MAG: hypothetical protein EOO10_18755 [Chitinophagaceae bacterium]
MKYLLAFVLLSLIHKPATTLLLVDTNLKLAIVETNDFDWDQFRSHQFPIYAKDRKAIIKAAERMAKIIDKDPACFAFDTVAANRSLIVTYADCQTAKSITVRLQTRIGEKNLTCNFELIKAETNPRKAQKKLLDLATYLDSE